MKYILVASLMSLLLLASCSVSGQETMPSFFVSHGGPTKAFENATCYGDSFADIPDLLPEKPSAILMISAHWITTETLVSCSVDPETIHDYGGFAPELRQFNYNAKGSAELGQRVVDLVGATCVDRGFDHGAWTVLNLMYPEADIPVVQMSIDYTLTHQEMFELAQKLRPLREEGVLIIGSGAMTHNLGAARLEDNATPVSWAKAFDDAIVENLDARNFDPVIEFYSLPYYEMNHPTRDHYWPLIYALGTSYEDDNISYPYAKFESGIFSMRNVMFS